MIIKNKTSVSMNSDLFKIVITRTK